MTQPSTFGPLRPPAIAEGESIPCPWCVALGKPTFTDWTTGGDTYHWPCSPCGGTGVYTNPSRDPETGERHGWGVCATGGCDAPCGSTGGCSR